MQMVKEAEWMRRQPKARSVKQAARVHRFTELSARTRSTFAQDSQISLGGTGARRQACRPACLRGIWSLSMLHDLEQVLAAALTIVLALQPFYSMTASALMGC